MVTDANTKRAYNRAQERAREMGGAERARWLGGRWYAVESSGGDKTYTVEVIERAAQHLYLCDCEAGRRGRICYHKGCVMALRVRELMRATVKAS